MKDESRTLRRLVGCGSTKVDAAQFEIELRSLNSCSRPINSCPKDRNELVQIKHNVSKWNRSAIKAQEFDSPLRDLHCRLVGTELTFIRSVTRFDSGASNLRVGYRHGEDGI